MSHLAAEVIPAPTPFATTYSDFHLHETADGTHVWVKQRRSGRLRKAWQQQVELASFLEREPLVYQPHTDQFYLYLPDATWFASWLESQERVPTEVLIQQALGLIDVYERWHRLGIAWLGLAPEHLLYNPATHEFLPIEWPLALPYRNRPEGRPEPRYANQTLAYASPEQSGKTDLPLDYRSDYFSLGVLLYQLATGQLPFAGSDAANTLFLILTHEPPLPHQINPSIPEGLSVVIGKLLAKNPVDRYQSASGLRHDLEELAYQSARVFVPGRADISQEFHLKSVFVGRQSILSAINETLGQVSEASSRGWIEVQGVPGSGKTAVLDTFENQHYGRYFILRSDARDDRLHPYATLRAGLETLVDYLLTLPSEVTDSIRFQLETGLGSVLPVLVEFCPAVGQLSPRLASPDPSPLLSSQATQYRLAYALAGFFKALVLSGRPVVWLLDNASGTADATRALLDSLFRETSLGPFTVIATSDAGESAHSLRPLTETWQALDVQFQLQSLPDLSPSDLGMWLRELRFHPEQIPALVALIQQKTGGTPYFVQRFLEQAQRRSYLEPVPGSAFFRANEPALATFETTHHLLGFLTEKIRQLPPLARQVFDAAVCFQPRFSVEELTALTEIPIETIREALSTLLDNGLLIRDAEPGHLTFSNPQLIDIGRDLLKPLERSAVFERVTRYLLASERNGTEDPFLLATKILEILPERGTRYASHLLTTARAALGIGAFELALRCYAYALKSLSAADWEQRFDYCFDLHCQYLQAAAFSPDTESQFEQTLQLLRSKARTRLHTAALTTVWAAHLAYRQRLDESIRIVLPVLQEFGIRLRYQPTIPVLIWSLLSANYLLRNQTPEQIERLPVTQDVEASHVVKLMQVSQDAIFLSRPVMLPETMLVQLRLSVRHGLSEISGAGFMAYAFMRASLQGQYRDALRQMELAIRLDRRFGTIGFELTAEFLKALFVDHWLGPLQNSVNQLYANYRRCRENGLLSLSFYSLGSASVYEFYTGLPLDVVARKSLEGLHLAESQRQSLMAAFFRIVTQACHDLQQADYQEPLFDGPHASFSQEEAYFKSLNDSSSLSILIVFCLKVNVLLNRTELPLLLFKQFRALSRQLGEGSYTSVSGYFYGGLACLQPAGRPTLEAGRAVRTSIAKMKAFSREYIGNNGAKYQILKGLYALRTGKTQFGLLALDRAIELAMQHQQPIEEAIAYELKGDEYRRLGHMGLAFRALSEAVNRYSTWGATAKAAQLRKRYPFLDTGRDGAKSDSELVPVGSASIDLLSFLKASNSIASTLRLDALLQNLLDVLLENAGAQKAALLLNQSGQLWVFALQEYGATRVQEPVPLAEAALPQNLIRYVVRTGQPLALTQAYTDKIFSSDAYFQENRTLSALAMPVIKNQECLAVMYLENNSTPGAFHPQRLEILQLLSSQVAISLENALLYDDMETRIRERTVQLQQEMEKSEGLLLNILPESVARELKQTGQATARQFQDVTVLFTDFVNFTKVSEQMGPDELVRELDECFRAFDDITARFGIEKIKTIGDAYLCAGGLQDQDTGHAIRVVDAALVIRDYIADRRVRRQANGQPYFDLRIGIHNGPLVAGVVGTRKFAYDIWGDTVNTAARMEQSGEPGQVNVSGQTWAAVQSAFFGTPRGRIQAKNKGEIDMYFVTGRKLERIGPDA